MMSETQTRLDVMTAVKALQTAWSDYALQVEAPDRDTIDQAAQVNPYLRVDIIPISASQADLADHPLVEQRGQILLTVVSKEGSGTVAPNKLLDFIKPYFEFKNFTLVRTHAVETHKPVPIRGWRHAPLLVNYWFHRVST